LKDGDTIIFTDFKKAQRAIAEAFMRDSGYEEGSI
jgi:hypothetical protein